MSMIKVITNFTNGYIVQYVPGNTTNTSAAVCQSYLFFPSEILWPAFVRITYLLFSLMNCFIGISVGSDKFMTSIEVSR